MRAILHRPEIVEPIVLEPESLKVPAPINRQFSAPLTIACDLTFLLITVGAGLLLRGLIVAVWPPDGNLLERMLVEWIPFWSVTTISAWFLLMDGLRCLRSRRRLPFDCAEPVVRHIYWQRLEIVLGAIATHLVLLCLCLLLPAKPLFSKVFLASTIALVALAVRKSIPTQKLAFAASTGIFSSAMLGITIAGMIIRG